MRKVYLGLLLTVVGLILSFAFAGQDLENVEIQATKLSNHVYMLTGTYGNMALSVGDDGVLLVDDDLAPLSEKIKATIQNLGGEAPRFILNTHWHHDHTHGNQVFGAEGSTIIAHTNVRTRLSTQQEVLGQPVEPLTAEAWPIVTFDRSLNLHFNGEEIKVIHYPNGHTDGDAVIYFTRSNVIDMGDLYFEGYFPNVDLVSGGSVQGYIANVGQILDQLPEDVKIIPGHGTLSTKEDLRRHHQMVQATTNIVSERIAAGKSLEQIVQEGLPQKWASLNRPEAVTTEHWLKTVYQSLTMQANE